VATLLRSEIKFCLPANFRLGEVDAAYELKEAKPSYRQWFHAELKKIGKSDIYSLPVRKPRPKSE
jgi:hypothetical protein